MNPSNETLGESANFDPTTGTPGGDSVDASDGAAGAEAGGLAEKGMAKAINPTHEEAYWRDHFSDRPYVESGSSYNDYGPAYALGVDAFNRHPGRTFDEVEPEMSVQWTANHSASSLNWERARHAARDAWNRISPSS